MKIYYEDETFFEKINTERKAYWLGFLYADGCIHIDKRECIHITLELHPKDEYILEEFIKDLSSNRRVYKNKRGYVRLEICNSKIGLDLINLGCVPRKSKILKFPTEDILPKELLRHFIRGYMDGDGCISTYMKLRKNKKTAIHICEIKFIGTYDMLKGIKEFFKSEKNILINRHSPSTYQISFTGKKYRDIVDSLYDDATVFLVRKKEKWEEYKKYLNDQEKKTIEKQNKVVVRFDKEGNYIDKNVISTLREDFDLLAIRKCCESRMKNRTYKQFRCMYLKDYEQMISNAVDIKYALGIKSKRYVEKKDTSKLKMIAQYDMEGNYISTWESAQEIAEHYNTTSKAIRKVCNGERKSCHNYVWKYIEDRNVDKETKEIFQCDLDGNVIREWKSCREAAKFYDVTFQSIRRAIKGKYKTCCGYVWKYK